MSKTLTRTRAAGFTVIAGLLLLCSTTACGTSENPGGGQSAPKVSNPADPTRFRANLCGLLAEDQLRSIGFAPGSVGKATTDAVGPECSWSAKGTYDHLGLILRDDWKDGLSHLYTDRDNLGYFDEVSVGGLPAVFAFDRDERKAGSCVINVGLSNDVALFVQYVAIDKAEAPNACGKAQVAAAAAVDTIRKAR